MVTKYEIQTESGNRKNSENISVKSETKETTLRKIKYSSLEKE